MNDSADLKQGSIVWARVKDPRGILKTRPLVIITATEEILLDQPIAALAITTTFPDPPHPNQIAIPWYHRGHPATRLRRRSAVVCNWMVVIRPGDVEDIKGYLPTANLLEVLELNRKMTSESGEKTGEI